MDVSSMGFSFIQKKLGTASHSQFSNVNLVSILQKVHMPAVDVIDGGGELHLACLVQLLQNGAAPQRGQGVEGV